MPPREVPLLSRDVRRARPETATPRMPWASGRFARRLYRSDCARDTRCRCPVETVEIVCCLRVPCRGAPLVFQRFHPEQVGSARIPQMELCSDYIGTTGRRWRATNLLFGGRERLLKSRGPPHEGGES